MMVKEANRHRDIDGAWQQINKKTKKKENNLRKKAFITGATGFLGINLVKSLSKEDWDITTYSLPGSNYQYLNKFDVHNIEGDLCDVTRLNQAIPENTDSIFHLAGNTSMWSKNAKKQYHDNVTGTKNIIDAAISKKAQQLIYTSSISAYGYHPDPVFETTPSNAMSCKMNYNITKYLAEQEVKKAKGLYTVILNPINIIGPHDVSNWTKQFIKPVYHNRLVAVPPGKAMWCHVDDIVEAHIKAVEYGRNGENYFLGGVEASFLEVVQEIQRQLGKKITHKVQSKFTLKFLSILMTGKALIDKKEPLLTYAKYKRAVGNITCNYSKAEKELGYHISPLNKMIKDTYEWLLTEQLL